MFTRRALLSTRAPTSPKPVPRKLKDVSVVFVSSALLSAVAPQSLSGLSVSFHVVLLLLLLCVVPWCALHGSQERHKVISVVLVASAWPSCRAC